MSLVKSTNTKPEIVVRKFLHASGIRYGLHDKKLPGCPDLKSIKYNSLVFVNGCFWHGHNCNSYSKPKTNKAFWETKIEKNMARDRKNKRALKRLGWNVIEVWQCELTPKKRIQTLERLLRKILQG